MKEYSDVLTVKEWGIKYMSEDKYQRISEKNTKEIKLTLPEIIFIDDHVSLMIDASDF